MTLTLKEKILLCILVFWGVLSRSLDLTRVQFRLKADTRERELRRLRKLFRYRRRPTVVAKITRPLADLIARRTLGKFSSAASSRVSTVTFAAGAPLRRPGDNA